jgi:hypothetical protein
MVLIVHGIVEQSDIDGGLDGKKHFPFLSLVGSFGEQVRTPVR